MTAIHFKRSTDRRLVALKLVRNVRMSDSAVPDSEEEKEGPSLKKKACQPYKMEYTETWKCLKPSMKGPTYVRCTVCVSDFSCAHGGRNDCRTHIETKKHKDNVKLKAKNMSMDDFFNNNTSKAVSAENRKRKQIKAELVLCTIIARNNLSFSTAPVLTNVFKDMFPDSEIAADMACGRNKSTVLIKELANIISSNLGQRMKNGPFTLSTDGSNDEKSKQYPVVIRTVNLKSGTVNSELLSVPICEGSATGENIFNLMDKELKERSIPWSNCLALGCDNANVMTGGKKGVFAFVKMKQPHVFLAGCTLHLVHIGAKKAAAAALPAVDDVLVDIHYYFNKSEKRQSTFKDIQELFDVTQTKMLKHVCTRWLSIKRCLERLIVNWDPLKLYMKEEKEKLDSAKEKKDKAKEKKDSTKDKQKQDRAKETPKQDSVRDIPTKKRKSETDSACTEAKSDTHSYAERKVNAIYEFIRSPTNKLYSLFLSYTVKVFDEVLLGLQAEEPKVHQLRRMLHKLIRNILIRFVKPSAMIGKSVDEVQYKLSYNIKMKKDLLIGDDAKTFIANKESNHLREGRIDEFYKNVVLYFTELCDYLIKKLPLNDKVLTAAEVADVSLKTSCKVTDLEFFIDKFPCLIPANLTKDCLIEQFTDYQSTDFSDVVDTNERMDTQWTAIGQFKREDSFPFKDIATVMCGILTIPHSSAHCERVFSCVRKNRTDQRSCLGDDSLKSLLVLKSSPEGFNIPKELTNAELDHIKGVYYRSLKS